MKALPKVFSNSSTCCHVLPLLKTRNKALACGLLADAIDNYRQGGAWEWIAKGAAKGSGASLYVATAANTLKAAELMECWN